MSNINSRRGTSSSSRHNHHYHANLDRIIQCFILTTAVIIIGGYYYFISSATSSVLLHDNNTSRNIHNIRGGGGANSDIKRNNNNNNNNAKAIAKATIGYAITVSGCPKNNGSRGDFGAGIIDGAAVLKHSIHLNSIRADTTATTSTGSTSGSSGRRRSKYDYQMYALVHPTAEHCARSQLQPLGYTILIRDTPVPLQDIQGDYLRERVPNNGCCGDKEFVKLHAYTLVEHPVVVHLDLDTLVMKPMDDIFDLMIDGTTANNNEKKIDVAFNDPIDTTSTQQQGINAFFTRDYNMANHGMKHVGVQGGFLVLRPDIKVYEEFQEIIRLGDFRKNGGWGGMGFGPFYGSMTFQGIIPYFYDHLHPGTGVELNPCVYNNMAFNPRDKPTKNDIVNGHCRDGYNRPDMNDKCEDCRSRPIEDVYTTHFTLCQKPWECHPQDQDRIQERLCRKFHGEWFRVREDLETKMWKRGSVVDGDEMAKVRGGKFQPEQFRGYCKGHGAKSYIPIILPDDSELAKAN